MYWISLHYVPFDDVVSCENEVCAGEGYSRVQVSLAGGRTRETAVFGKALVCWVPITHVGLWTDSTEGRLLTDVMLINREYVNAGDSFCLRAGRVFYESEVP